jgi:hypothetical protein
MKYSHTFKVMLEDEKEDDLKLGGIDSEAFDYCV